MRFCRLNPQNDAEAIIEEIQRGNDLSIIRLKFLAAFPPLCVTDLLVLESLDGQQQWEADVRGDPIHLLGNSVTVNVRDGIAPTGPKLLPQWWKGKPEGEEICPPKWIKIFVDPADNSESRPANNKRGAAPKRRATVSEAHKQDGPKIKRGIDGATVGEEQKQDFVNAAEPKIKIGINGYGSIGAAIATVALESQDVELVAINDPYDQLTCLFRDSGLSEHWLRSVLKVKDSNTLIFGEKEVTIFRIKERNRIPWKSTGAEYIITSGCDISSDDALKAFISEFRHYNDSDPFKHCLSPLAKTLENRFGTVQGASTTGRYPVVIKFETQNSNAVKAIDNDLPQWRGVRSGLIFQVPTVDASPKDTVIEIYEGRKPTTSSRRISSDYDTYRLIPEKNNITPSPGFSKLLCWCIETTIQIPRVRYCMVRFK